MLFVIGACEHLDMRVLECFGDIKQEKMMQLMCRVSSTAELKPLASCNFITCYHLDCFKSWLQVIISWKPMWGNESPIFLDIFAIQGGTCRLFYKGYFLLI